MWFRVAAGSALIIELVLCVSCQRVERPIALGDADGETTLGPSANPDLGNGGEEWSEEESEDPDGNGDGGDFIPPADAICGPPAPGKTGERCYPCDPMRLDDCPAGEKCTAYATQGSSWDWNKCVPIQGTGQPGDDCEGYGEPVGLSGEDSCGNGSMCWDIDWDTGTGYCLAFCQGSFDEPECPAATLCAVYNNGVLPICVSMCDPLLAGADCKGGYDACAVHPGGEGFVCLPGVDGGGAYGTECQYTNSCNAGLYCAPPEAVPGCQGAQGCCSEICDLDDPMASENCSGHAGGQTCLPWFEMGQAPAAYEHIGACAIP